MANAQEQKHAVKLYFRQGDAKIDVRYKSNARELKRLDSLITLTKQDSVLAVTRFEFESGVSPEGGQLINKRLVQQRLTAIVALVKPKISLPDEVIEVHHNFIDWTVLRDLVAQSDLRDRDEVLRIIDNVPEHTVNAQGRTVNTRYNRLVALKNGLPYREMYNRFFPLMRYAQCTLILSFREPTPQERESMPVIEPTPRVEPTPVAEPTPVKPTPVVRRPFYMALTTNMLFDAALVPNIGVEFYLGSRWSLAADWHYSWWRNNPKHDFWRLYGGGVELRKWFGSRAEEKPLQGHHLGVYGYGGTYDFELGKRGYLSKWSWSAGVGYGYSLPIAKRINFDFGVNAGYLGGNYKEYLPIDGHYVWQTTKNRHYFGITKAYVSFAWLLGYGNYNERRR